MALEDIQNFLEARGPLAASLTYIGPAVDAVAALQIASVRQRTLNDNRSFLYNNNNHHDQSPKLFNHYLAAISTSIALPSIYPIILY